MTHCISLLSAFATVMTLASIMPCGASAADAVRAASLGHNKAIARWVYEEGLDLGRFEVPMVELEGFREAFPEKGRAVVRMADGRLAEELTCGDSLGRMKPLGMLPAPATGSATRGSRGDGTAR